MFGLFGLFGGFGETHSQLVQKRNKLQQKAQKVNAKLQRVNTKINQQMMQQMWGGRGKAQQRQRVAQMMQQQAQQ